MSMNLLTGGRAFPWKNWFFLGGGIGLRLFQNFMDQEQYALLEPDLPSFVSGSSTRFSLAPQYYFEGGLVFPTKFLNIEIGYRWRGDMLGMLQNVLKVKTDIVTQRGWGELVFALTVPLGKQSRTQEEFLGSPTSSLEDGEFVKVDITDVFFAPNQTSLNSTSQANLNRLIPLIETLNPRQIIVRGHTYYTEITVGGNTYATEDQSSDIVLSRERAQAVKSYLEAQGIRGIIIEGVASDDPLQGASPEKQRRVQVILVK
jgi:outer membrane protein OmpA-like peptidoglycan-associated protein